MDFRAEPRAFLAKDQNEDFRQVISLPRERSSGKIWNPQRSSTQLLAEDNKFLHRRMMTHVLVTIRNHCTAAFSRRRPMIWTSLARKALALRTAVPMFMSCCQFSMAIWKSCRR